MDERRRAVMIILLILFGLAGLVILFRLRKREQTRSVICAEYWVFLPGEKLPPQDEVMTEVFKSPGITPKEGLLFSDIRLHTVLVLRKKNSHLFRPDLFADDITVSRSEAEGMNNSESLVRVRFLSEITVDNDRYLRLLPHLAAAIARLGNSTVIYDHTQRRFFLPSELEDLLIQNKDAASAELHVRVGWEEGDGPRAVTIGLVKKGLPEIETLEMNSDEKSLVAELVFTAAKMVWNANSVPPDSEVEFFGAKFLLSFETSRKANPRIRLRMLRLVQP